MRTIKLQINQFQATPHSLKSSAPTGIVDTIKVSLTSLFHHYYLAKYGNDGNDTKIYEYQNQLTGGEDWRFLGNGIGIDKEAKKNASNELGKAFARWFNYTHLGMTYFAPLENLIDQKNLDGSLWIRNSGGDLPDYVCGADETDVNLLEAKGRYRSVSFSNAEFDEFRKQIQRASLKDKNGKSIQVKGFISAARWATANKPAINSTLYVEDPFTDGEPVGESGYPIQIGRSMTMGHYASIFRRLQLPIHADAIRYKWKIPSKTSKRGLWECISGPFSGMRFVGGIISNKITYPCKFCPKNEVPWYLNENFNNTFILHQPHHFFGVEEETIRSVIFNLHIKTKNSKTIRTIETPIELETISLLRDGTIFGPADYFRPIGIIEI